MNLGTAKVSAQTETEIAVLQVKVENIENDVAEIKSDIKALAETIDRKSNDTQELIKEMAGAAEKAHMSLNAKISTLEKWRWMMMGAGIVLGTLGYDTLAKLLK
jgi:DNA repair exonuclease SbcCD ATPase subunit